MHDLLIRGATVVNADRTLHCDIAIDHGRIAALLAPGAGAQARRTCDAEGLIAIPGLVDAHVHLREPGLVHKEGFAAGSRAAAAGGVTTVMVMPTDKPLTMTPDEFEAKRRLAENQTYVDFCLQALVGPKPIEIERLIELGCVSFEIFLADVAEDMLLADAESLLSALSKIRQAGGIAGITPGDHDVVVRRTAASRAAGSGPAHFAPSRPPVSEALGVARICVAAQETGAHVHIRQMSCASGLNVLAGLKTIGRITAEATPHNLKLDESELDRQGAYAKVAPPLRPRSDVVALLGGLSNGIIDIVATDHAPHLPIEKDAGSLDIWKAPGGLPGLQTFLPVMLSLVQDGAITLQDLVRTCATRPADLFGLSSKGRIAVGCDADIVLIDLQSDHQIRNSDQLSKAAHSPFNGMTVSGKPTSVFLRGIEIMRHGVVPVDPVGRFVSPQNPR